MMSEKDPETTSWTRPPDPSTTSRTRLQIVDAARKRLERANPKPSTETLRALVASVDAGPPPPDPPTFAEDALETLYVRLSVARAKADAIEADKAARLWARTAGMAGSLMDPQARGAPSRAERLWRAMDVALNAPIGPGRECALRVIRSHLPRELNLVVEPSGQTPKLHLRARDTHGDRRIRDLWVEDTLAGLAVRPRGRPAAHMADDDRAVYEQVRTWLSAPAVLTEDDAALDLLP